MSHTHGACLGRSHRGSRSFQLSLMDKPSVRLNRFGNSNGRLGQVWRPPSYSPM